MLQRVVTIVCLILLPGLAFAKKGDNPYASILEKINPTLVHIVPTEENDKIRLPMGCTGFFIDPALLGRQYSADFTSDVPGIIATNLSCLLNPEPLNLTTPDIKFINVTIQNAFGQWYSKYDVLSFHPILNLVFLKVIKMEGDQSTFASVESDKPTNIKINLDPSKALTDLISIRFPSQAPQNDVLPSKFSKAMNNQIKGRNITYILHSGLGQPNGFEGSPLIASDGTVIGINSFSNFYFFNVGFSFSNLIKRNDVDGFQYQFANMILNVNSNLREVLLSDGLSIMDNDAYDEALFFHPLLQKTNVKDPFDLYYRAISNKIKRKPSDLFKYQALDYMIDIVFDLFDREVKAIEDNEKMNTDQKTFQMGNLAKDVKGYFEIFYSMKSDVEPNFAETEDPYLHAYSQRLECKYQAYKVRAKSRIGALNKMPVKTDAEFAESCEEYLNFMEKQKSNFDTLKSEPYPTLNLKDVLKNISQIGGV